jgi:hypothetical protein
MSRNFAQICQVEKNSSFNFDKLCSLYMKVTLMKIIFLAKNRLGVNVTNVFCVRFWYERLFSSYVSQNITRKKTFIRKTCAKNVGEIDPRGHKVNELNWQFCV